MGCCGKAVVKHTTIGHTNLARDRKYEFADDRIRACQKCIKNFWVGRRLFCQFRVRRSGRILWPDPNAYVPALAADEKNECLKNKW